ncbi:OLC1v1007477C1 [Oldenlandia corymbosa var. corymbosa]|nr:OLC1v1007477C1 [Oldenlandia corymbosa var. corymbosa]
MDYIIALSCTPPRIYRQIASLMGLQLVTSFINVAKMLSAQRETTQRQLNVEKKKKPDGPRVESLNKRLSITHERITMIEEMMRKLFTGLFVHRYRDTDPDIRMSCIQSLGVWILSYPSLFLQDLYLKYLGWTLNDKSAGVRKASVQALQNLYEVDDNVPSLGLFTERFYKRMLELADDIDISVAVCAIGLVKQLLRHQLVPDEELGSLYDLLIDDPPEIRRAIGALVYDHLIAQKFNSSQSTGGTDDSSKVYLGRMLQILHEFATDQMLSIYVIDDVWEYMGAMKDWKCIISMLLDNNPSTELSNVDATSMIRLMCSSIKKAVGERIVPASDNRKPYHTKAQRELFDKDRLDITVALMKNYPLLLRKFMADKEKVPYLVEVIVYMNLQLYAQKKEQQRFKSALKLIREAFFKHGDKDTLRSCVKAFSFCATESPGELQDFAQNQLKEISDEVISRLKSSIREIEDGDDEYSFLINLKRLYEFHLSRPISIDSLYDEFSRILQASSKMDDEVICFILLNMFMHVTWTLEATTHSETVSEASLSSLLLKRDTLFLHLEHFLVSNPEFQEEGKPGKILACRVCILLAELWYLFRKKEFASTKLEDLGFCPLEPTIEKFWKTCEQLLQISDETEDDDVNREYVEETNRDAVMIAAAKLVYIGAVPENHLGSDIISHFVRHGASISDIVKNLITALKKIKGDLSDILIDSLKKAYQSHLVAASTSIDESLSTKTFHDCKNLAIRLSGLFVGASRDKHRLDEIRKVVDACIDHAFSDAPKHLSFLDGAVLPFVSKLPTTAILDVLEKVQKKTDNIDTDEDPSGWHPYHAFVDTLNEKYARNDDLQDEKEGTAVKRRGRPRKNQNVRGKKLFNEDSSSEDDEDSISESDQFAEGEEEKQEDEDEEVPLIRSFKSSAKLRSLRVSREDNGSQTKSGDSNRGAEDLGASRT